MKTWTWDKKRLFIEGIIALICAFIGVIFGKSSNTYYYNGQKITETELNSIMKENAEYKSNNEKISTENKSLLIEISKLEEENDNYMKLNKELSVENKYMNEQISLVPSIDYYDLGLVINGEEKTINKNKSLIIINGNQYYSKDFIDSLISQNDMLTIKDDIAYIGRVVFEKANLFNKTVMDQEYCEIQNSGTDSYGNTYSNILHMGTNKNINYDYIIYVLDGKYSFLKFSAAIRDTAHLDKKGTITIKADDQVVYISDTLNKKTKLFTESEIPINNCDLLTIEYNSEYRNACMITNAEVYN